VNLLFLWFTRSHALGKDGLNGINGINGVDGKDGTDGAQGPIGQTGPQGPIGIKKLLLQFNLIFVEINFIIIGNVFRATGN
jgi:Collagen triple helix repeat (20 copies)